MAGPLRVEHALVPSVPDLAGLATDAELRYSTDAESGIARRRAGRGFHYVDPRGASIRDAATIARIRALAIPPAWNDVWICRDAQGHLQAAGRDARGRKQSRYHPAWRAQRDESPRPTYGAKGPLMDTASRIPGPEPQEAATTRPKRAKSDTPPPHCEAAFGGAIVGAIAGEVTGAIVGGPPGAIVGGIVGRSRPAPSHSWGSHPQARRQNASGLVVLRHARDTEELRIESVK
jgi:hypothetical protein